MKVLPLALAVSALAVSPVFASDYQAEVGFNYGTIDADGGDSLRTASLFGEVFFAPVDTSKGALNEASFLSKSSGLHATYTDIEDADDNSWNLGGRFVFGQDYIIEADVVSIGDSNTIGIGFGKYLTDTTDLVFSYASNDDDETDALAADLHSVVGLSAGASLAYSLNLGRVSVDDESGMAFGGDLTYYFNKNAGIGFSMSRQSVNDIDTNTWGLFADWFVTDNLDLRLDYGNTDVEGFEIDTISGSLSFRF